MIENIKYEITAKKKKRTFKQLTEKDRYYIEISLKNKVPVKDIAKHLHKTKSAIYLEIKKGTVELLNTDLTTRKEYLADLAQRKHDDLKIMHSPGLKIGNDYKLAEFIEYKIINEKLSPYAVSELIKREDFSITLHYQTIYRYIDSGLFLRLTNKDLPVKKKKKRKYRKTKVALNNLKGTSIEERPDIEDREEFGHWEMDSVIGRPGKTKSVITVLTERKTRKEIVLKSRNKSSKEVIRQLDRIERKLGIKNFRKIFKTITVDNGSEFLDQEGIERSCINKRKRTRVYYCHPYSSYERGSNENQNKLIRRWYPKGYDIDKISKKELENLNAWINGLPRKIFNGRSSEELYREELKKLHSPAY